MNSAVIVAAGSSRRMGPGTDKLFLDVCGFPLIAHTWMTFDSCEAIDEVVVVIRSGTEDSFNRIASSVQWKKSFRLVRGGAERQDSVSNGLSAVSPDCEIVVVQDGARPCTTFKAIQDTIADARQFGAAVAARRVSDTLKETDGGTFVQRTIDRSRLWAVQTPQAFRVEILRSALNTAGCRGLKLTDDAAACELIGQRVRLVECSDPNPKVTSPVDVPYIEWLLGERKRGIQSSIQRDAL